MKPLRHVNVGFLIEFLSDDAIKIKFLKLWDFLGYFERTTSERPSCQKLALWGKLPRRY